MSDTELRAEVDAFLALPRAERRAKYESLDKPVKLRVRKALEARRGIAYRAEGGVPVFTKDEYIRQMSEAKKRQLLEAERSRKLQEHVVELKQQLLENWGEEALAEAETALEALESNS